MTIRLYNIAAEISEEVSAPVNSAEHRRALVAKAAQTLGLQTADVVDMRVVGRAIDARHKPRFVYTLDVDLGEREREMLEDLPLHAARVLADERIPEPQPGSERLPGRIVVIGAGPGGLFAAFTLARHGYRPLVIERGKPVAARVDDVACFHAQKALDPESNCLFGEGGAGTFSDGKLTTRIDDVRISSVLATLIECGAPDEIAYDAKPHVGTDRLRTVIENLRKKIEALGGEFRFSCRLDSVRPKNGVVELACGAEIIESGALVLAIGQSARDTYAMLRDSGVALERRAFQMGLRIEHAREMIDGAQYGRWCGHPALGAADYRLVWKGEGGCRPVYSFCMCPGGEVMAATAQDGCLCTNGMSNYARDSEFSNSALVAPVTAEDFASFGEQGDPLAGVRFQEHWERAAFHLGGEAWCAPAQPATDFLAGSKPAAIRRTSYRFGVTPEDLAPILPDFVIGAIRRALPIFGSSINGFDGASALLMGPETRVSSPVRIPRNEETRESVSTPGLYPVGEGAGYASGIMSSAVDGVLTAEAIISRFARP
jgi:hypothetical protein